MPGGVIVCAISGRLYIIPLKPMVASMRVLHVFKTYLPDSFTGVERVIWELAEGTARRGGESDVLSLTATAAAGIVAVGEHFSHRARRDLYVASTGLSISIFAKFRALASIADIVHYHFPWPMMDLMHFLVPPRRPTVLTYHSDIVRQKSLLHLYSPLMHRFLGSVDRIVATSPNYLQSSKVLRRYEKKTTVIPIGIEDASPVRSDDQERWRRRVGDRFFLFVGALRYYKGLHVLLDAAEATGLPIVLAGAGELEDNLRDRNLANVIRVGAIGETDKETLLSLCTGFVFPSHLRSEAFGVALLEAARAGRPMISSEMGTGTSFVNVDGDTGITVPPGDAVALGDAMMRLWNAPLDAERMGLRARARFEALFTAERMVDSYMDVYASLLSERK